jgi:hypothetical protein
MRVKHFAALLIAVLVVIPTLSRAQRKLDHRSDLKPAASFRDVDRPPELNLEPANTAAVTDLAPVLTLVAIVEPTEHDLSDAPRRSRASLRAPPPLA